MYVLLIKKMNVVIDKLDVVCNAIAGMFHFLMILSKHISVVSHNARKTESLNLR